MSDMREFEESSTLFGGNAADYTVDRRAHASLIIHLSQLADRNPSLIQYPGQRADFAFDDPPLRLKAAEILFAAVFALHSGCAFLD